MLFVRRRGAFGEQKLAERGEYVFGPTVVCREFSWTAERVDAIGETLDV